MTRKKVILPENKSLDEIVVKLDIIIKLLANSAVNGKNATEATAHLRRIGLSNKEIAEALNLKENVVSARLSNVKKTNVNKIKKEKNNE
jgi:DNA-binding CsgD family transcriptional regulator